MSTKIYMTRAQRYIWTISANSNIIIASRRFGKSEGVIAPILLRNLTTMPRSQGAIVGATYKQMLTRTLPATFHALERIGFREGVHYFVGRRAPKTMNFPDPIYKPRDWSYYIHWYNGSIQALISQDIPFAANSGTYDYLIGDEAKTLNREKLFNELLPAVSGTPEFRDNVWHRGINLFTDMPTNRSGKWILDFKEKMDIDLLRTIETLILALAQEKKKKSTRTRREKIQSLEKLLNAFRKKLLLFATFSILENIEIVGEDYILDMYRNLPRHEFYAALLSQFTEYTEGGFYAALNGEKHYYHSIDNSFLQEFRTVDGSIDWRRAAEHKFSCRQDADLNSNLPLLIALDTNININWIVVGQADYQKNILYTLNAMYVKHPQGLAELIHKFADYYEDCDIRDVIFYYDHTFLQGRSAIHAQSFADTIIEILEERGWSVEPVYIGHAPKHAEKHKEIDMALKGQKNLFPMFNQLNCETLLRAMERTRTRVTTRGWGKDKSEEKLPDSPDNPVELRTDGTDAWDTLFWSANFFRKEISSFIPIATVR